MDAFDRYAPFIQDFIYDHDWQSLRAVQVAACFVNDMSIRQQVILLSVSDDISKSKEVHKKELKV